MNKYIVELTEAGYRDPSAEIFEQEISSRSYGSAEELASIMFKKATILSIRIKEYTTVGV
jgi:hypothetical protein